VYVCCTVGDDDSDVMMNEWIDLVQKKNDLVREESDLIYRLPSDLILVYNIL